MMEHLALSHPEISIKFVNGGQVRFHTSGNGDLKEVIYRIYGREITEGLLPFSYEGNGFSVNGYLGKPEINRANRNYEICFINGRYVHSSLISKAMEEGYHAYLMQHKFPFYVLHFMMDQEFIDVNVHPAKMEIRIRMGAELYEELSKAVSGKLRQMELIPDVKLTKDQEKVQLLQKTPEPFEVKRTMMLAEENAAYQAGQPKVQDFLQNITKPTVNRIIGDVIPANKDKNAGIHANVIKAADQIIVENPIQLDLFDEKFLSEESRSNRQILGQIFDTYWLVALKDKLFIIDQHAAHEKVKYERLVKELEAKAVSSQELNPPIVISLTGREEEILQEFQEHFRLMGFEFEEFGSSSYMIRSMPADLYGYGEKEFFLDILDEIADNPMKGTPDVILQKLASMACKAAVKGNHSLSQAEAEALIDELLGLDDPYHCPHGRPTIISMTKYEIEKNLNG